MKKHLRTALAITALAGSSMVQAALVPVSYLSTSVGPLSLGADTFIETGLAGTLSLDNAGTTNGVVNLARLTVDNSGFFSGSSQVTLDFSLTLGGVTHLLSQSGTFSVTPSQDSVIGFAASGPVLFTTSAGNWNVSLNSFQIIAQSLGTFETNVSATFQSVPEPLSLALVGIGLLGATAARRRQTA